MTNSKGFQKKIYYTLIVHPREGPRLLFYYVLWIIMILMDYANGTKK